MERLIVTTSGVFFGFFDLLKMKSLPKSQFKHHLPNTLKNIDQVPPPNVRDTLKKFSWLFNINRLIVLLLYHPRGKKNSEIYLLNKKDVFDFFQ